MIRAVSAASGWSAFLDREKAEGRERRRNAKGGTKGNQEKNERQKGDCRWRVEGEDAVAGKRRRRRRELTWMLVHFEFGIRELVMNNASALRASSRPAGDRIRAGQTEVPGEGAGPTPA